MVSTGIPGILLWISTFILCIFLWFTGIPCGQKLINVLNDMIIGLFHQELLVFHMFNVFWGKFHIFNEPDNFHSPHVPNELGIGSQYHLLTVQHTFMLISTYFTSFVACDIHQ